MPQSPPGQSPSDVGASEPPAAPVARRVRPRWRRRVAGILLAFLVLALAHLPWARERVRRFAVGAAHDRFGTALTIGRLDYNLLTLTVSLHEVSAAAVGAVDRPFFRADRLTLGLTASTLIGRLAFTSIELVRPRLAFTRDAEGRYLLPAGGGGGQNPRIRVGRLAVRGLDLQIEGAPPLTIEARGVAAALGPRGAQIQGRLTAVNGMRFRSPSGTTVDLGVDGTIGLSPDTILVGPLDVTMGGSRVRLDGRLPFAPGPLRLDLSLSGTVSLADAAAIWPALGPARGVVSATCTVAGPVSDPVLTFEATARAAAIRAVEVSAASAKGTVGNGAFTLASAAIDVAGGRVTGAGSFGLGGDPSSGSAQWRGVDLRGLLQVFDVSLPVPIAAGLDGKASFAWSAEGLASLRITGETEARRPESPARRPAPRGERPAPQGEKLSAGGTPAPQGRAVALVGRALLKVTGARWVLDLDHRLGAATSVAGRLSGAIDGSRFAATTLRGRLEGSIATGDVAHALTLVPAAPDALRSAVAGAQGDISAALDLSGRLGDPRVAIVIDAPQLRVDGFGDGTLHAEATLDRRGAAFSALSATLLGTAIQASGELAFDGRSAGIEFTGDVSDVAAWLDKVPAAWRPSGRLAAKGRVSGPVSGLHVDGSVTSASLAWPFWNAGSIEAGMHLSDGRVRFDARVPSVDGTARGSLSLSSPMDLDVFARVEGADLQRLGDIATGLGAPKAAWTGAATLSAHVTGVVDGDWPMTVEIGAEALSGAMDGRPVRLISPAHVLASSARVATEGVRLEVGQSTIAVTGSLPAAPGQKPLRIEADGDVGEWWPVASGRVHAAIDATGSPSQVALNGEAALSAAALTFDGYAPLTGVSARARLAHGAIELVDGRASWSGAEITAKGRLPLAMLSEWLPEQLTGPGGVPDQLSLSAGVASLTEKALEPWLGAAGIAQVHGQMSARIDLQASKPAVEALQGTATITQSDTTIAGITLRQPKPAQLKFAEGRIQLQDAAWTVGRRALTLSGGVDVRGGAARLDLRLAGELNLAALRAFVPLALAGTAQIDARATGDARHPSYSGGVILAGVTLGIPRPRVAISGASGHLTLDADRVIVAAQGDMNGGTIAISGSLPLSSPARGAKPADGLRARATSFLLEWPEGLRSMMDGDVTYRIDADGGILAGRVEVEPGAYRRAVPPEFTASLASPTADRPGGPSSLDATRLDLAVATRAPGMIDNSYARLEVEGDVHVGGTIGEPEVGGRLLARQGGRVFLRGNVFTIESAAIEFDPDPRTKNSLTLLAGTRRSGYDITMRIAGPVDDLRVILTSDPPLAQPDLMALVTTGSTSNSMSPGAHGDGQDTLVAAISSDVLGLAGRTVGLDSVRVGELELDLMGDDVDPQTRLTIGKSIGSWLDLLLSQNLRESGFTWAVTVHPVGAVEVRFVSQDSKTNSVQVAHQVVFGRRTAREPAPAKPRTEAPVLRVASVAVSGGGLPERDVLQVTGVRPGDRFDFFEWQRDRDRIEALFHSRGYLQVQVSATRDAAPTGDGSVALRYQVRRGPLCTLLVSDFTLPDPVIEEMKAAWTNSVNDAFLEGDLRERVRGAMADLGYLWPEVSVAITSSTEPRQKTADVRIAPGPHASDRKIVLTGWRGLTERELQDELVESGAGAKAWREPAAAVTALEALYRRRGFLAAKATAAPIVLDAGTARLPIVVDEGPRSLISRVEVRGAGTTDPAQVVRWLGWRVGDPFNPADTAAARRIEAGYVADGYRGARASVKETVDPSTGAVVAVVDLQLGVRSVVGEVQVNGRGETRESIVRRAIDMPPGSPASSVTADRAQRRLYETEAFRSVDVQLKPMTDVPASPKLDERPRDLPTLDERRRAEQPTRVVVTLEEAPLYRLRYGVQLTDDLTTATQISDLRVGVSAELRRRNLFGTALNAGIGGRIEPGNYSARAALNIPTSVLWPALSTLFLKESLSTEQGETGPVETVETSLTYQERWRIGQKSEASYGYDFTRETLRFPLTAGIPGVEAGPPTHRASLFAALAWDARDSLLDATRGWFHSSSLEVGAPAIASDFSYVRYMFQQTVYRKVGPLVLAGAARTGVLVHVTGDDNETYSLRFRTGGDRTVRGYALDSLSAPGESGAMVGGRALLLLNGEVRFPVWRWLKAATFLDAGNAFVDPAHLSISELKIGAGFGLRLDTPYALFRFDVGFPYPQPSSRLPGRFYFSIGQAF